MTRPILSFAMTDTGVHRAFNEDSYLADDELGLYVVADGMGGHAGGEVASRIAVECVRDALSEAPDELGSDLLASAIRRSAVAIHARAQKEVELAGMGTTLTAVAFARGVLHLAHVGDSRCYLIRGGDIRQLSEDHTVVQEMLRSGLIGTDAASKSPMRHYLSRAVGNDPEVLVDHLSMPVQANDVFILCSDGLVNVVREEEIRDAVLDNFMRDAPRILVDLANQRGGPDNITVVVLGVNDPDD
jgi:protein phosphatase